MTALIIIGCVAIALGWYLYKHVPLVAFEPVHMGTGQRLDTTTVLLTTKQVDRIMSVLTNYGERCRRQDKTTVLITPKLSMDQELIWNYTTKAGVE